MHSYKACILYMYITMQFFRRVFTTPATTYVTFTSSYGIVRKARQVSDAKVTTYSGKEYPMLLTDKVVVCAWSGVSAIYLWPVFLYWDVKSAEARCRHIDLDTEKSGGMLDYVYR